jgi:hypothetical protein
MTTTFFDVPWHLREIIWKQAHRMNVEEGCARLVAPLHAELDYLKSNINKELEYACYAEDHVAICSFIRLGADPTSPNGAGISMMLACTNDKFLSVIFLLNLPQNFFHAPRMKPCLRRAFKIAKDRHNEGQYANDDIVKAIASHYSREFDEEIGEEE